MDMDLRGVSAFNGLRHPVCVLNNTMEILTTNKAWQTLFGTSNINWIDGLERTTRNITLEKLSAYANSNSSELLPAWNIRVKEQEFSISISRDDKGEIVIELVDITNMLSNSTKIEEDTFRSDLFASMLTLMLQRPHHDTQLWGQFELLREILRDLQRTLYATLSVDLSGSSIMERKMKRQTDILRSISKGDPSKIELDVRSIEAKPWLQQHMVSRQGGAVIEKVIDANTIQDGVYFICDPDILSITMETVMSVLYYHLDPAVNRIRINAKYLDYNSVLLLTYTYTGQAFSMLNLQFLRGRLTMAKIHDLLTQVGNQSEEVDTVAINQSKEIETVIIILRGFLDTLSATIDIGAEGTNTDTFKLSITIPLAKTTGSYYSGRPIRPLFADDNPTVLKITKRYAQSLGHIPLEAKDGIEVFKVFKEQKPDIVFLDLELPIVNGVEALKQMRQWEVLHNLKRTPVIVVTGKRSNFPEENVLGAGADAYVDKPLDKDKYMKFVANYA
jgi:CheY-like chemotaxis protein